MSASSSSSAEAAAAAASPPTVAAQQRPRTKVVMVVGTTGSGKSRLGIELAAALGGEVVNADVIQMYAGLDVASAKVPAGERGGVPHHLLSFLEPRTTFTVRDFRAVAGALIDDIARRGRLPVVVGGTLYYCQALLRDSLLEEDEAAVAAAIEGSADASSSGGAPPAVGGPYTFQRLQAVDPVMAQRLHPHDARKIARALQVYDTTGLPYSEVLRRQQARLEAASAALPPSEYDVRTLWLQVGDPGVLAQRLDGRVDAMVAGGLLAEVRALRDYLRAVDGGSAPALAPAAPAQGLSADAPSELTVRAVTDYLHRRLRVDETAAAVLRPPFYWPPAATGQPPPAAATMGDDDGGGDGGGTAATATDYSGLLQAIGYKELSEYLDLADAGGAGSSGSGPLPIAPLSASGVDGGRGGSASDTAAAVAVNDSSVSATLPSPLPSSKRQRLGSSSAAAAAEVAPDPVDAARARGIDAVKQVTRRYARKQERWIRNRFAARGLPMTRLDTADAGAWADRVLAPALADVRGWLQGQPQQPAVAAHAAAAAAAAPAATPTLATDAARTLAWRKHECETCGRTLNGDKEWADHLASRGHAAALKWHRTRAWLAAEKGIVLPAEGASARRAANARGAHGGAASAAAATTGGAGGGATSAAAPPEGAAAVVPSATETS